MTSPLSPLQLSLVLLGTMLTMSSHPSAAPSPFSTQKTHENQPENAEAAGRMVVEEEEEEKLDEEEQGLTVPEGSPRPALIVVMGPASCGKSTVGNNIASRLHLPFIDGDSLHPRSNVDKMSAGQPLADADRLPWLALIRSTAERVCREEWRKATAMAGMEGATEGDAPEDWRGSLGRPAVVIACSALKTWYRDILRGEVDATPPGVGDLPPPPSEATKEKAAHKPATHKLDTYFVYCKGSRELLWQRISSRKGHFMKPTMLDSQLATLEDPTGENGVCVVDIGQDPEAEAEQGTRGVTAMCRR